MGQKVLFVVNPYSGRQKIRTELINVIDALTKAGCETVVMTTQGRGYTQKMLKEAEGRYQLLICSGGDGTFNEVLSGVMTWDDEKRPLLGYIPAGSTNDFASGVNLSSNIGTAIDDIIHGQPHTFDAGMFNDTYFSYVASFGAFTEASYSTPQNIKNSLGHFAYILEGLRELSSFSITDYPMHIEYDGQVIEDSFAFGAVSNAKSIGGVFKMSDDFVDLNDGLFEVMLIRRPKTPIDISQIITSLNTMNYDNPMFLTFQTNSVSFMSDRPLTWSLDGERMDGGIRTQISCIKDAYQLIVNSGDRD